MAGSLLIIILLVPFAEYLEPFYDLNEKVPSNTIEPVKKSEIKLRQMKPVGLLNEMTVLCCASTMSLFCLQSTNEAILTQVTKYYLGFGPTENGYVYAITGGSASLGYLSLVLVLRFFKERTILLSGLVIELFMSILLLALMGIVTFRVSWFIPLGVVGLVLFSAVLSYIMATASSILAKSTEPKNQSIVQVIIKFIESYRI